MYQQGGSIKDALDKIASSDYVLPAIQREFVWRPEQICRLFDSIMQGYPFGEFLFWQISREHSHEYRWYGFVRDYHQRDNPHCPDLGVLHDKALTAVLDGQQRLTAFNIGLRGSMAVKQPRKWWSSPDAFPKRVLALDLLHAPEPDEEGDRYAFEFVDPNRIGLRGDRLWYKVGDILVDPSGPDMSDWIHSQGLTGEHHSTAYRNLDRLHRAVCVEQPVVYYEEKKQDIEHVLNIFIRRNSGGTFLSYSDLLLSIAVSQWSELDARREIHQLVDELNRIGNGFNLTKDFVLKAGLMLTDISSVGFKVENFTHRNMEILEGNWSKIREALISTVELVSTFGFDSSTIRAQSSLLPIAYYLYQINSPATFETSGHYVADRDAIKGWLTRSLLKASGIWGSGLDTLLTALRDTIRASGNGHFPAEAMRTTMAHRGKSLDFTLEEVEDLSDIRYGDNRLFALLTLLFPHVDCRNKFHIDHVYPRSRFTPTRLKAADVPEEAIGKFRDCVDGLANLQLLDGQVNSEKRAKLPADWLEEHFPDPQSRRHYCDLHGLGDVPNSIKDFLDFYDQRREILQARIAALVEAG